MAYKMYSGSSFISLDGVTFVVGEKWRPPKKVTLPMKFETSNPSEFLFLEYDSTTEEQLLAQFQVEREMEQAAAAAAAAAAAPSADTNVTAVTTYCPPTDLNLPMSQLEQKDLGKEQQINQMQMQSRLAGSQHPLMPAMTERKINSRVPNQTSAAYHVMNGNILVPTPISASGESAIQGTSKTMNNFDLKDFENEQDPFENLSLKVINDIEELDKVFLASSTSQSALGDSAEAKSNLTDADVGFTQQTGISVDRSAQQVNTGAMSSSRAINDSESGANIQSNSRSIVTASTPSAADSRPLPLGAMLMNYMSVSDTAAHRNSSISQLQPTVSQQNVESGIPDVILANNLMSSVLQSKPQLQQHFKTPDRSELCFNQHSHGSVPSSLKHITDIHDPAGRIPPGSIPKWAPSDAGTAWPPAAVNSYSFMPTTEVFNHTRPDYGYSDMSYSSKVPLRSAKSNPDLSVIDNHTNRSCGLFGRQTPPIFDSQSHLTHRNSDLVRHETHAIKNNIPTVTSLSRHENDTFSSKIVKQSSIEGNMYSCLSDEAQSFVDYITAMGFPKLQTIRAVQKLGIDEKLVLDHLCGFSKLMEKGYKAEDVEKALFLFESDLEKAEAYSKSAVTFRSMGFDADKISTALVQCSLDEEKSLDWLTT